MEGEWERDVEGERGREVEVERGREVEGKGGDARKGGSAMHVVHHFESEMARGR